MPFPSFNTKIHLTYVPRYYSERRRCINLANAACCSPPPVKGGEIYSHTLMIVNWEGKVFRELVSRHERTATCRNRSEWRQNQRSIGFGPPPPSVGPRAVISRLPFPSIENQDKKKKSPENIDSYLAVFLAVRQLSSSGPVHFERMRKMDSGTQGAREISHGDPMETEI